MFIYPYFSPIILTDDIFISYGGLTGTTTSAQRQVAYLQAEIEASNDISTFLLPTTYTGTYLNDGTYRLQLDHTYINDVSVLRFLDFAGTLIDSITGLDNYEMSLRDKEFGLVDLARISPMGCSCFPHNAYKLEVVYNAGLSSGSSYQPSVLMALTTYASIFLNEISGYGNESVGDIGVQSFSNLGYSENRVALKNTTFGNSAKANLASRLLNRFKIRRFAKL